MSNKRKIELIGQVIGRWTVLREQAPRGYQRQWECRCECGTVRIVDQRTLRNGTSVSCGCYSRERHSTLMVERNLVHGLSKTPEYRIWKDIRRRCLNPRRKEFKNYGGRGIFICDEWRSSFAAFLAYVGKRPAPHLTLDRVDNDRGYEPGNIRWTTRKVQRRNSRAIRLITVSGVTRPLFEWLEITGISRSRFKGRLADGWSEERAVSVPVR